MLEIEKPRQDMLAQEKELTREGWRLVITAIAGTAGLFAAAAAFIKLIQ